MPTALWGGRREELLGLVLFWVLLTLHEVFWVLLTLHEGDSFCCPHLSLVLPLPIPLTTLQGMSLLFSCHFMIEEPEKHIASQNLWGSRELFDLQLASSGIQRALEQGQGAPACARHGAPVSLSSLPASLLCSPTGVPAGPPTLQTPAASGPVPLLASAWGGVGSPFQVSILSFLPSSIQSNILFPVKPSPLSSPLKIPNPHHWFLPLPCCFCLQSTYIPIWHNISVRYHVAPPQKHINFTSMDSYWLCLPHGVGGP